MPDKNDCSVVEIKSPKRPKVSLIVPAYNENQNLSALAEKIHKAMAGYDYEVMVVDDSSDGTADIVKTLSQIYPIEVLTVKTRRGLATAVGAGFKKARGDILGVMDADLQHPPEMIPMMIESVQNGADIAVASRYTKQGSTGALSRGRELASRGTCVTSRMLLPSVRRVRDPMSRFFLLKKRVIENSELHPFGDNILLEILAKAKESKVEEIPYRFHQKHVGTSKFNPSEYLDNLRLLSVLAWKDLEITRFLRFCVVGIGGVGLTLLSMWLLTSVLGLFYFASAVLTSFLSITSNFIFNDIWTFRDSRHIGIKAFLARWAKFNASRWLLFLLGLALLPLFVEVAGLHYLVATIIIIGIQTVINYSASVAWIWRK